MVWQDIGLNIQKFIDIIPFSYEMIQRCGEEKETVRYSSKSCNIASIP